MPGYKNIRMKVSAQSQDEFEDLLARAEGMQSLVITISLAGRAMLIGQPGHEVSRACIHTIWVDRDAQTIDILFDGFAVEWLGITDPKQTLQSIDPTCLPADMH